MLVTALIAFGTSVAYTFFQTPLYQASTRLFVSATAGDSAADLYQSSRYSQERVLSYTQLIMGETLAQRTIDRLGLDMSAAELKQNISAKSKAGTVLIDVYILDRSPLQARDVANALSDEFVLMIRELETPSDGGPPDGRVIVEQRASVPEDPVVPKRLQNLATGIVAGIVLGLGLAFVRERLDNTVKTREDLEAVAGVGVVGYIPLDKKLQENSAISFDTDNSSTAEAFRKLRTNLQFLAVDHPPRVLVITSSSPSEGKTTTSVNIALALAEAGSRVVLVDGDLRRPRLAKQLNLVGSVGFSTALSGGAPLNEILQKTNFPRLTVLTSGAIPPNPSELLGSKAAKRIITELSEKFDFVVIDSAPLLAVTDSAILASEADGAIIIVRAGSTKREQLTHAVKTLKDVDANLLGAVLSMIPTGRGTAYGYSYSYRGVYGDERPLRPVKESSPDIRDLGPAAGITSGEVSTVTPKFEIQAQHTDDMRFAKSPPEERATD